MPTYEYRCSSCGHQFEVTQKMTDDPVTECQVCGGEVSRLLFAPAIHFKGSGFHNTDYGTKRRPVGGEGGDSGGASSGGDGASSGGDGNGSGSSTPAAAPAASSGKTVGLDKA